MGYKKKDHEQAQSHGSGNRGRRRRGSSSSITSAVSSTTHVSVRPLAINEETRWKPRSLTESSSNSESNETQDDRLVLLLLNKLTPQNFDKVVAVFLAQTTIHESNERMKEAIKAIIDRASLDMRYAQVYARLCQRLATDLPKGSGESCISFLQALLNDCRESVNATCESLSSNGPHEEDLFEHPEERELRLSLARRRYVGSKRFIGELFNSGLLELANILSFVELLLDQTGGCTETELGEANELALEGLCVLLDSCGKALDETAIETAEMQRCWQVLNEMIRQQSHPRLSSRMKYMILDLLELRESCWSPTRFSSRQRRNLVAKVLEHDHNEYARNARRHSRHRRVGKKKGKTVHFAPKSVP